MTITAPTEFKICSPTDFSEEANYCPDSKVPNTNPALAAERRNVYRHGYFANVVTMPSGDNLRIEWLPVSAKNRFPLLS